MKPFPEHLIEELVDKTDIPKSGGIHKEVMWLCQEHGEYKMRVSSRVRGARCRQCANKNKGGGKRKYRAAQGNPLPQYLIEELVDKSFIPSAHSNFKFEWECSLGHRWFATPNNRFGNNSGCAICRGTNNAYLRNPISDELRNQLADDVDNLSASSNLKLTWQCEKGHQWKATVSDRTRGRGCPNCNAGRHSSEAEMQVRDYISSFVDVIPNDRSVIKPKELDIYIPSRRIAVEYNGLYWHSEAQVDKNDHYDRVMACKDAGIQLIYIWEDDWATRPDVVKRMLKAKILGRPSIGARKTRVVDLKKSEADAFLGYWHIQGPSSGTHYTGLYTDELVAVMVTTVTNGIAEIKRFASSVAVVGGMDKMMKHLGYSKWVTFADLSISNGGLYESTGWIKDSIVKPDYKYVVGDQRIHKFNYRLKRFKNDPDLYYQEGLTEKQLASHNGLLRIYDAGKIKYTKTIDNNCH